MPNGLKRYQTDGHDHAINFSCHLRQPFLTTDHSRIVFEETLERLRQRHQCSLFAYVLMPDHVHPFLPD